MTLRHLSKFVSESCIEHRRVVGINSKQEACLQQSADRMLLKGWHARQTDVASRTEFQGHPPIPEFRDQKWIFQAANAMANTIRPEGSQGAPDTSGPNCFAGMRHAWKASRSCPFERQSETFGWIVGFIAAETKCDDAVCRSRDSPVRHGYSFVPRDVSWDVDDDARFDSMLLSCPRSSTIERSELGLKFKVGVFDVDPGGMSEFGIAYVLRGLACEEVACNFFDIFLVLDAVRRCDVDFDEVREVSEAEPVTHPFDSRHGERYSVLPGEGQ